jgi:two-component system response regulator NreC
MNRIKVILADDHVIVRQGLHSLIDHEDDMVVIGEAGDGLQLLSLVERLHPDVALVDLKMPNLNGITAAEEIYKRFPTTHTVILSMHTDRAYIKRAFQAGVLGYVIKEEDFWEICTAIRHAAKGNRYLSKAILQQIHGPLSPEEENPDLMQLLTYRERLVFQLVAEGKTNGEIADTLGISIRTVEGHRSHLMSKLNLKTIIELIHFAQIHGILNGK